MMIFHTFLKEEAMMINWSAEQFKAIYDEGKDILVNAGAGSGKTAVLTQRLLQKIEAGVKLDELIVLTFTTLAASEMKERLRTKLKESKSPFSQEALLYIDQANIQTFDAFVNELVRKYHYLLNINSQINVVDQITFKMISLDLLNEIFNQLYQEENPSFLTLLYQYTTKDDEVLKHNLIELYHKIVLFPNYQKILMNNEEYFSEKFIVKILNELYKLLQEKTAQIENKIQSLHNYTASISLKTHYEGLVELGQRLKSATSYDDYFFLTTYQFAKLPSKVEYEEEKEPYRTIYEEIKTQIASMKELFAYESSKNLRQLYLTTKPCVSMVVQILLKLDQALNQYKYEHHAYDFNDIAQMAIQLLEENEELRNSIKKHTKEILIDEYQDTSDIQERLVELIADNNVYMVGDVKQSIYRFRNANPDIFKNKYQKLKETGVIDLTQNFRSRKEVLDFVNLVFQNVMSLDLGGVDYNDAHYLNYGFKTYDTFQASDYQTKIYTYDVDEKNPYSKAEIEAFLIAEKIKQMVNQKKIFDKNIKDNRLVTYQDFAILTSSKDKYDLYKKIFEYQGIPLQIYKDQDFTAGGEIYAIYNLLKVIYSFYDQNYASHHLKRALTSVLRSYLVEMNDDDITKIITSNHILASLKEYNLALFNQFETIAMQLDVCTLKQCMQLIYQQFDIYIKMIHLYHVEKAESCLLYMYNIIDSLSLLEYSFIDVINYFALLVNEEEKFAIKMTKKESLDNQAVKMMSIHASKGLEFPICFFPELYKKFNLQDLKGNFLYSKNYQIIMPIYLNGLFLTNPLKFLEQNDYLKEEISERIRLLYVALTRPKEEAILVLPKFRNDIVYSKDEIEEKKLQIRSFYDLLNLIAPQLQSLEEEVDLQFINMVKEYHSISKDTIDEPIDRIDHKEFSFFDTSLKKRSLHKIQASKESIFFRDKEELEIIQLGNYFHKALELSNMSSVNVQHLHISEKVKHLIIAFLESSFIKEKQILQHYHEYAFSYEEGANRIEGIIDLIIETKDCIYIIDYKLSNLDDIAYTKQLSVYKNYMMRVSNKKIDTYLYSIYKQEFKKVTC